MNKNRTPEGSSSQVNDTPSNPDVAHRGKSRAIEITKRIIAILGVTAVATVSSACSDQQNSQQGYQPEWHDAQAQRAYDDVIEKQNFSQAQAADSAARQANEPEVRYVPIQPEQYTFPPIPPCNPYLVQAGDNLWRIASFYTTEQGGYYLKPDEVDAYVRTTMEVNGMQSPDIFTDTLIQLPSRITPDSFGCKL